MLLAIFTACDPLSNDDTQNAKSNMAALTRFAFTTEDNPSLTSTSIALSVNGTWWITVPEGTDLRSLAPEITASPNAAVLLEGEPYVKGKACDFSGNSQRITVVSESGEKVADYRVCVKTGDSSVDREIFKFMNDFNVPGVSLSIMKGTKVVYSSGYGFAVAENGTRCTPDHLFRMASISKQFCTFCIMMLKEQGRLSLDQPVFGDKGILKGIYKSLTAYHEGITVRHLLSHSSGICKGLSDPAFTSSYRFFAGTSSPVPTDTLIQRTIDARQFPYDDGTMVWSPGMGYNYSNVGFCILHRIVEVISGKDYESYLKEDVLERMGVTDTHIGGYQNERRPNECVFYSQGDANGYANPLRELAGAAGIITSTSQLMKILTCIDGDDTVPDIFSFETLQEMYSPYRYSGSGTYGSGYHRYGLGWRMNHSRLFEGAHYHGGNIAGTATLWVAGTNSGMSGAFVCNSRAYNSNSTGDIDDNLFVILNDLLRRFE